jgi:hypothetical protein
VVIIKADPRAAGGVGEQRARECERESEERERKRD